MKRTEAVDLVMNLAAIEAIASQHREIEPEHLLMGILKYAELQIDFSATPEKLIFMTDLGDVREVLRKMKVDSTTTRRQLRRAMGFGGTQYRGGTMHRSMETKRVFYVSGSLAEKERAATVTVAHLLKATLAEPSSRIAEVLPGRWTIDTGRPELAFEVDTDELFGTQDALDPLKTAAGLVGLTETVKKLRGDLRSKVFGQDHAIHAFVEGMFNAEVLAEADQQRRRPKALFVFAGPSGVGKTFLAETAADALGKPFKRFDMSGFSDHQSGLSLVGVHKSYQGAHAGLLTEFVLKNPNAMLLFDEIEKAHLNVVQLFLQVMDAGRLEDKYTEKDVEFRDTIIIFTTNAGRALYEDSNATGVYSANTGFHRKTILDALQNEKDPRTGKPFFPEAICSRMATGYAVMFNRLGVTELEKVAAAELDRVAQLMAQQYNKKVEHGPLVPLCLVLREGIHTDARTVRSQVEAFIKAELFNFSRLFKPDRLELIMQKCDRIFVDLDPRERLPEDVKKLLHSNEQPRILLVADEDLCRLWTSTFKDVYWRCAADEPDVLTIVRNEDIDVVLLDLMIGPAPLPESLLSGRSMTIYQFDNVPFAARGIARGQEILRGIHRARPDLPCFLVSFEEDGRGRPSLDDELLIACVQSGGARGVIETGFCSSGAVGWERQRDALASKMREIAHRIWREKKALELGVEHKALSFDTAPAVEKDRTIRIRLRNMRLSRALAAEDVSEVLNDVERPSVRFADVYGAAAAKAELEFVVNWLKDPRRYRAMGLRQPKGILIHGAPGTGKTMLARALAGECNAAFLVSSATGFVTIWQGSGPQNVRDLFARARRYAPSIVFIDEIDAIGNKRTGGAGASASAEQTLNALLTEMDGFGSPSSRSVIVLAATNRVDTLDDALIRRFDRAIEVDKPDRAARDAYLRNRLQGSDFRRVTDAVVGRLAGQSANMTVADLERAVEQAGRTAAGRGGVISDEIIEEAFARIRMGEVRNVTDRESLLRTARHEAGHCLVGWLRGEKPVQVSIVARGNAGGFVERENEEERTVYTRSDLLGMIRQMLGGRAAEIVYYGNQEGLTTGVSADLRTATHYAELMVRDYGMAEGIGSVFIDPARLGDGPLAIRVMEAAERILREQLDRAVQEITAHRSETDRLVDVLMEKNRLTREELELILPGDQ